MNVYIPGGITPARLPDTYQEVEWIQSSGTQYINTGLSGTAVNCVELSFLFPSLPPSDVVNAVGARESNKAISPVRVDTSSKMIPRFGSGVTTNTTLAANKEYTVKTQYTSGSQTVYVNGTQVGTASITWTRSNTYNIFLFGLNNNGSLGNSGTIRVFSCKMYSGDTLLRNFVPCYRISDSVIGLYDLVNSVFYTNSGTGTFSKGNDVNMSVLKNIYIGEYIPLYEGTNGKILHMKTEGEIWLIPTSGTTIKIQDKDVGSSVAGTTSSSRGEWYIFDNLPTAPTGYHIPTKSEWDSVISLWMQITGSTTSTLNDLIMEHLLLPGAGWKNSSGTQNGIGASLYWSSTGIDSSTAYGTAFYPNQSNWNMFNHNKNNKLCMRFFKNT